MNNFLLKNSFYAPLFRHFYTFLRFLLDIILSTPATLFDIFRCYYSISAICNVRKVKVSITSRSDVADINQRFRTYHFTYLSCWSYLLLNSAFNMDRSINLPVLVSEPFKNKCGKFYQIYFFELNFPHFFMGFLIEYNILTRQEKESIHHQNVILFLPLCPVYWHVLFTSIITQNNWLSLSFPQL